jgi:hypothetical protein
VKVEIFDQIVLVTEDYLGPAAKRFITRHAYAHLGKSPSEVSLEDIPKLLEWTTITLALLTEDKGVVDEYARKMTKLLHA